MLREHITKISIVILTKNGGILFQENLDKIFKQNVEFEFDVIAIDSGSTDETIDIIKNYNVELHEINPSEFNFGLTRNLGFSLTRGDIIVTISQDAIPSDEYWLRNLIEPFFNDNSIVAVQGRTNAPIDKDVFYWDRRGSFFFTSETRNWKIKYKFGLSFVNCAIKKEYWYKNQIGSLPFSEDKYFQKIIIDNGYKIGYARNSICYHGHQYTYKSLRNRIIGEGKGWRHVGVKYKFRDCLSDIIDHKWMLKEGINKYFEKEINSVIEILYLFIRPIYLFIGNNKS